MSRNANITSFFKPASKSSQSPQPKISRREVSPTPPPPPSTSPLSALFSSSPPAPASTVRDRNAVIRGSDEEDDDDFSSSDDDFPSLFPKPSGSTLPPRPAGRADNVYGATPKAKRRAVDLHSSPLTINTRHKFDIKALLKHAEADNVIEESEQRTAAILAVESPTASGRRTGKEGSVSLHDSMLEVLSDPEGSQDEENRARLMRAVRRTEATVERKEWHFFDRQCQPSSTAMEARPTFPKAKATGVWTLLASEAHRSEVFEDGLAFHIQSKMRSLPDEIFQWVLNEVTHEKHKKLRDEYLRLLGTCPDQIERLMDEDLVLGLFRDLGASGRALGTPSQPGGNSENGAPYPEHNRGRLQAVLRILAETAHALRIKVLTGVMSILLRLGIDNIVREDYAVSIDYQDALLRVVLAVPWRSWNNFCGHVIESLYIHTVDAALRWNAVSAIPLLHPKLVELRRRLALVFVFDDARRAFSAPEETFSIRSIIDRLDQADEFIIDRTNTDYFELLALSEMLSVAVGDGSPPRDDASPEATKQYNAEVDELAHRIRFMWSNIHEQGAAYMSRMEARVQLKDFERKLQHAVRTRPPPRGDIFELNAREDEVDRPRQQQFMKRFLSKSQPPPKTP